MRFASYAQTRFTRHTRNALAAALLSLTAPALAETQPTQTMTNRPWSTTSHLGFAVVDNSTTDFDKSTGSLVFLDLTRRVLPDIDVGVRTIAQGASLGGRSFYRLGAGPLVSWRATDRWHLQLALSRFDETGMHKNDGADEATYRSQGYAGLVGWERVFRFGERVELAWGGFIIHHQGDVRPEPAAAAARPGAPLANANSGLGHGVEVALRVAL